MSLAAPGDHSYAEHMSAQPAERYDPWLNRPLTVENTKDRSGT
jgi:hypothetical protein